MLETAIIGSGEPLFIGRQKRGTAPFGNETIHRSMAATERRDA